MSGTTTIDKPPDNGGETPPPGNPPGWWLEKATKELAEYGSVSDCPIHSNYWYYMNGYRAALREKNLLREA